MPRSLIALAGLVLALVLLAAPAPAEAAPRPGSMAARGAAPPAAVSPFQQPDAPADDGTGASADDEGDGGDQNPPPGAVEQDIIPKPNSGHEPTDAGDRGGALQIVVFLAIVAGVGTVGALAWRDVRRSRPGAGTSPNPGTVTGPDRR